MKITIDIDTKTITIFEWDKGDYLTHSQFFEYDLEEEVEQKVNEIMEILGYTREDTKDDNPDLLESRE